MTKEQGGFESNPGAYFDAIADRYDELTAGASWMTNRFIIRSLGRHMGCRGDVQTVLDLGAGTGNATLAAQQVVAPERIVAVDASAKMLAHLQAKVPGAETVHNTVETYLATSGETFDLVMAAGLEFVQDLPRVMPHIARKVAPRGLLIATYLEQPTNGLSECTFHIPSSRCAVTEYYWPKAAIEDGLRSGGLATLEGQSFVAQMRGHATVMRNALSATRN